MNVAYKLDSVYPYYPLPTNHQPPTTNHQPLNKKSVQQRCTDFLFSARSETRTHKDITPTASETATFTNFAIRANFGSTSQENCC